MELRRRNADGTFAAEHGETYTRLHNIWESMLQRCFDKNSTNYSKYGLRGISVCDEWKKYEPFRRWSTENGYSDALTLDRIDVNGNYSPSNCRWATYKEQARNTRRNVMVSISGVEKCIAAWAEEYGINYTTAYYRLRRGVPASEAFIRQDRRKAK